MSAVLVALFATGSLVAYLAARTLTRTIRRSLWIARTYRKRRDMWRDAFEAAVAEHKELVGRAYEMQLELDSYHREDARRDRVGVASWN